jgi:predicted AlkP superfamily phosphohydrolase/phosphomutase
VPDLCGTQATYFFLTSNVHKIGKGSQTEFGGVVSALSQVHRNLYRGQLVGPVSPIWKQEKSRLSKKLADAKKNAPSGQSTEVESLKRELESYTANEQRLSMPIEIEPARNGESATVRIDREAQSLTVGKWSDWYRVRFKVSPFISVHGICKALLQSATPIVDIYVSPIEISPEKPVLPICYPGGYCKQLVHQVGLFKTRGWESDTAGLKEGALDEKAFLEDIFATMDQQAEIALSTLDYDDWSLFVAVLSETDRMSHVMWRLIDPLHPAYDKDLAAQYGDSIQKIYQRMDDLVGKVRAKIDETKTDLYVLSDHGFRSFRKGVNLNTWLSRNGPGGDSSKPFMKLRGQAKREYNLQDIFGGSTDFFMTKVFNPVTGATESQYYVDWPETKAFALGLGSIYINLKGRETWGNVVRSSYNALCEEIIAGLEGLIDPETGQRVVHKVYKGIDIYHGPYAKVDSHAFPDLVVGFEDGYRVGWQSTLGGISEDVLTPNREKWSGDHCGIDPSLTKGILFSNRAIPVKGAGIVDLAPTILATLGVPCGGMQGKDVRLLPGPGSR